jgi:hypothetical protein
MINAQLEGMRACSPTCAGSCIALDTSPSPGSLDPGLAELKSRAALFRQSMDEVRRNLKSLPAPSYGEVAGK